MNLLRRIGRKILAAVTAAVGWAVIVTVVQAQTLVSDFTAGQANGAYSFPSWTPKTLGDLLKGNTQGDSVNIKGHLFLPAGAEKVPALVFMHGALTSLASGLFKIPQGQVQNAVDEVAELQRFEH